MVLDASLLNTQHYKVWIKGKVDQSRKRICAPPTPWCSSYRKKSLKVTLDYGHQLYFCIYIIYIYKIQQRKKTIGKHTTGKQNSQTFIYL